MPYINERWLGGMLTNFSTISGRVKKMQEYERMKAAGDFEAMPKKEALILSRELEKLQRNLGGIRSMSRLPDAVFIIDTKKEHIAVTEANKLGLPIVAVVDTNCDPDLIDYVIPGNDDAIRAGTLMCRVIADAVEEGRFIASAGAGAAGGRGPAPPPSARRRTRRAWPSSRPRPVARPRCRPRSARPAWRPSRPPRREPAAASRPRSPTAELPPRPSPSDRGRGRAPTSSGALRRRRDRPPPRPVRSRNPATTRGAVEQRWLSSPPRTSSACATPPAPG